MGRVDRLCLFCREYFRPGHAETIYSPNSFESLQLAGLPRILVHCLSTACPLYSVDRQTTHSIDVKRVKEVNSLNVAKNFFGLCHSPICKHISGRHTLFNFQISYAQAQQNRPLAGPDNRTMCCIYCQWYHI